jgi:hypothetical protein
MTTAPPTPPDTDAAAFVAALRRLKAWSGLSYRRLERHPADAGHCLPYSTAATMLGRERLPREELVAAFVAACGIRGDQAQAWLDARTDIACGRGTGRAHQAMADAVDTRRRDGARHRAPRRGDGVRRLHRRRRGAGDAYVGPPVTHHGLTDPGTMDGVRLAGATSQVRR